MSPGFRTEVESWVEKFIITEDNNILTLMKSTIRYSLLRIYLAAGTSMADNEQNAAIKAHIRRTNAGGSDPDDDAWDTRIIYHSARAALVATAPRPTTAVQAPAASGSAPSRPVRTTAASRAAARTAAAPPAATTGAGSATGASEGGTAADHTAAQDEADDQEEEVTGVAPAASVLTNTQMQQVISLLNSI